MTVKALENPQNISHALESPRRTFFRFFKLSDSSLTLAVFSCQLFGCFESFVCGFRKFTNFSPQFLHVPFESLFPAPHPLFHAFFPALLANYRIALAPQDEVDCALTFLLSHESSVSRP